MNKKIIHPYSKEAFRRWLTQNFTREALKAASLRAFSVKKIYFLLCGMISEKKPVIYGKSLEFLAAAAGCCKHSALKAVAFLAEHRFIRIDAGTGRRANSYFNFNPETGVKTTKNGKALPFVSLKDFSLLRALAQKKAFKAAGLLVLANVLIFANSQSGLFMASKETLEQYTQLDRRTIDSAFKALIDAGILAPGYFPAGTNYKHGNRPYRLMRKKLETLAANETPDPAPSPTKPTAQKSEMGPPKNFFADLIKDISEFKRRKAKEGPPVKTA